MEITEQINFDIQNHINESLGMFDKQYEIAEKLSNGVYDMILHNERQKLFNVEENDKIKFVDIIIEKNILKTSAKIYGFNDETHTLKLVISFNQKDLLDKDSFIRLMKDILTHELMHGNIFLNRYLNGEEINDMPDYYEVCQKIFNGNNNISSIYKEFAYALYSVYYQEMQAIVSQTSVQIDNYYKQKNIVPNRENFKEVLQKIDSYLTYFKNIHMIVPTVKFMLNHDEKHFLNGMNELGFSFNKKSLEKTLKMIVNCSNEAIENIDRNAMVYFYENIK